MGIIFSPGSSGGDGGGGGGGSSLSDKYCIITDSKAKGTVGGTTTANTWITSDLNTVVLSATWASLSSDQISLDAGDYMVEWRKPSYRANYGMSAFYNDTDSTYDIFGQMLVSGMTSGYTSGFTQGTGHLSLSATKDFELRYYCLQGITNLGHGASGNLTTTPVWEEIYSTVKITKLD